VVAADAGVGTLVETVVTASPLLDSSTVEATRPAEGASS
jgi:hypothetical protein